jgi:glutamate racemase
VIGLIGAAAAMVQTSRVGVLATPATVASEAYRSSIEALHPGTLVVQQACPEFVPLIESGDLSSDALRRTAKEYLQPLLKASVESIVLGCTHYPLLEPVLRQLLPDSVQLIDPAVGVARQLDSVLGAPKPSVGEGLHLDDCRFCVTADPDGFATRATPWLGERPRVQLEVLQS